MSIAPITTSTKMQNGIYCCVIHKMKYIVDILCRVITLLSSNINLFIKKCFFRTYTTAIFQFFITMNINFKIFIKAHMLLYSYDETRSSHWRCSIKNFYRIFVIFTGKHLVLESLFNKVAGLKTWLQKDSQTGIFLWILKNICEWLLLMKHSLLHHK